MTLSKSTYKEGDIETKRYVIGSIYPEKLYFDGGTYRTPRVNVIAQCILLINRDLLYKKNRTNELFSHLSGLVAGSIQLSNQIILDFYDILECAS